MSMTTETTITYKVTETDELIDVQLTAVQGPAASKSMSASSAVLLTMASMNIGGVIKALEETNCDCVKCLGLRLALTQQRGHLQMMVGMIKGGVAVETAPGEASPLEATKH